MTDRNKIMEMLERLVNEDREGAEELFHEFVVAKSREIYEQLLAEEAEDEDIEETTDEEVEESEEDELEESEEEDDLEESEDDEEVDESFFGEEDPTDDMAMDIEMPGEEGDDMEVDMGMGDEDGDMEDRVADLEDELEALKAEFEALMGDEGDDEDEGDMDMDAGDDEGDDEEMPMDMDSEEDDEEMEAFVPESKKTAKSAGEQMREYVEKVSAKMGDNGANTVSPVAKPNNMGGTSANIAKGGTADEKGTGAKAPKEESAGNVNVPGAKGATKMASQPGHGAEKKGKPETAANTKSTIGSK